MQQPVKSKREIGFRTIAKKCKLGNAKNT